MSESSKKIHLSITLSPETVKVVDEYAKREHRSRSQMIDIMVRQSATARAKAKMKKFGKSAGGE